MILEIEEHGQKKNENKHFCCELTSATLAAFLPNSNNQNSYDLHRSVKVVLDKNGEHFSINELNSMYDPLHYPLMFPHGELGFNDYVPFEISCNLDITRE